MRYLWQHIGQILDQYDGTLPLHHFLKSYFKRHPKLGSRDRRGISDAVYAWYRAGKAINPDGHDAQSLRLAALYLCGIQPRALASFFPESWANTEGAVAQRIDSLRAQGFETDIRNIFPFDIPFSDGITPSDWRMSMLQQPGLFLRIRSGRPAVIKKLEEAGILHEWHSETCLALPNGTRIEGLLPPDSYVVQDAASQETGRYLSAKKDDQWWDCCSGAGGKSLMLKDGSPSVKLLTTDVRQSILNNLQERFRLYHHSLPQMATLDAGDAAASGRFLMGRRFDGIICDVPCSGPGTWARTPESCYFFNAASVAEYAARQTAILRNAARYLKEDGRIVYITCSVFRAENEDVIGAVSRDGALRIESAGLINGLARGADALYAAVLRRA